MPMKPVQPRRWQVWASFLLLTASCAVAVWALTASLGAKTDRANERANQAKRETEILRAVFANTRQLRAQQLRQLHAAAVVSCRSRHRLSVAAAADARAMSLILSRSLRESQAHPIPGATPEQQAAISAAAVRGRKIVEDGIVYAHRGLTLALAADCKGVPPLKGLPTTKGS